MRQERIKLNVVGDRTYLSVGALVESLPRVAPIGVAGFVSLIIDTSARVTTLGYADTLRLGLPLEGFPIEEASTPGGQQRFRRLEGVRLTFDAETSMVTLPLEFIHVLDPALAEQNPRYPFLWVPSVLGLDALQNFIMNVDWQRGEGWLTLRPEDAPDVRLPGLHQRKPKAQTPGKDG